MDIKRLSDIRIWDLEFRIEKDFLDSKVKILDSNSIFMKLKIKIGLSFLSLLLFFGLSLSAILVVLAQARPAAASVFQPIGSAISDQASTLKAGSAAVGSAAIPANIVSDLPSTLKDLLNKTGSVLFSSALRKVTADIASKTAVWLGSGAKGQKPQFLTAQWGDYFAQVGDNALGDLINGYAGVIASNLMGGSAVQKCQVMANTCWDSCLKGEAYDQTCVNVCNQNEKACESQVSLSTRTGTLFPINFCSPNLGASVAIALGLTPQISDTSYKANCSFTQMQQTWKTQAQKLAAMSQADWMKNLSLAFNPTGNTLGAALIWRVNALGEQLQSKEDAKTQTAANGGWQDARNFAGQLQGTPGNAALQNQLAQTQVWSNLGKTTTDIFADAANIFVTQYLITLFQHLMSNLGSTVSGLQNLNGLAGTSITGLQNSISKLLEPQFTSGNIDVLGGLSSCPDKTNPGPDSCVIGQGFASAISSQMTVAEAVAAGYLDANQPFGFSSGGDEPAFDQGYPYRSLLILRKYSIIPVGWELAAEAIQEQNSSIAAFISSSGVAPTQGTVTLGDLLNCFNDRTGKWCAGLVDPNWVLKLPATYCKAQGYGPQFLTNTVQDLGSVCHSRAITACSQDNDCNLQTIDTNGKTQIVYYGPCEKHTKLVVQRDNNYCADQESCIQEKSNGNCGAYGYCTQDTRSWSFGQNAGDCQPLYNTCTALTDSAGRSFSVLADTLNYGSCNIDAVGCNQYATGGAYLAASDTMAWAVNNATVPPFLYFNKKVAACDSGNEGCHQFIRAKACLGTNLAADSSFEDAPLAHWPISAGATAVLATDQFLDGKQSLHVTGAGGLYSYDSSISGQPTILPAGFVMPAGDSFNLLVGAKVNAGTVEIGIGKAGAPAGFQTVQASVGSDWQMLNVELDNTVNANYFYIKGLTADADFYLDDIKFESCNYSSGYVAYGGANVVTEKLLPSYLAGTCYNNPGSDYTLKKNAPVVCNKFVRQCNLDEVDCDYYTSTDDGSVIPAKAKPKDNCPQTCVGYASYVAQADYFNPIDTANFIPSTANACSANVAGCSRFVNLDKPAQGGEQTEYYAALNQCVAADDNTCQSFYAWQTGGQAGQLTAFRLKGDAKANTVEPLVLQDDSAACNALIYAKSPSDPFYNPDCIQFINQKGEIFYHLYDNIITCSANCHPYRKTDNSLLAGITTAGACQAAMTGGNNTHWDSGRHQCVVCRNNGQWDDTQQACVYRAVPGQGVACSAAEVGCTAYTGNAGANIQILANDNFDSKDISQWTNVGLSNDSVKAGGAAALITASPAGRQLGNLVSNQAYTLTFFAKRAPGNNNASLSSITLADAANAQNNVGAFIGSVTIGVDWQSYKFSLPSYNIGNQNSPVSLYFSGATNILLDEVRLVQTSGTYYLLKNSWQTPTVCDQDAFGNTHPGYMVGCRAYTNSHQETSYLKSFSQLCQDSAVGCEQMIDTNNSAIYQGSVALSLPAHRMINVVYDPAKLCDAGQKGCQRLGAAYVYGSTTLYRDTYLLNDPDNYSQVTCTAGQVGCTAFDSQNGDVYAHDPGKMLCEWRLRKNSNDYAWLRKAANYCYSLTAPDPQKPGQPCLTSVDCAAGQVCEDLGAEIDCPVSAFKTIGYGNGNATYQPTAGWAGLCPDNQAGCTEYIDPVSRFSATVNAPKATTVSLSPHQLYILRGNGAGINNCTLGGAAAQLWQIGSPSNELTQVNNLNITDDASSLEFVTTGDTCAISGGANVTVRPAIVAYELAQNLDKVSANGLVKFDNGQVLFNERAQSGDSKANLIYNANLTDESAATIAAAADSTRIPSAASGRLDANVLLKVRPDRHCSQWLACKTYMVNDQNDPSKNTCFEMGLCDSLDSRGECNNFINPYSDSQNKPLVIDQSYLFQQTTKDNINKVDSSLPIQLNNIANLTGYSQVGWYGSRFHADLYNLADMSEEGQSLAVNNLNGDFSDPTNPWSINGVPATVVDGNILNQPQSIQAAMIVDNAYFLPSGKAVLAVTGGTTKGTSADKTVLLTKGQNYVISGNVWTKNQLADIGVSLPDGSGLVIVNSQRVPAGLNAWTKVSGGFVATGDKMTVHLWTNGQAFFNDIRIEPSLLARCNYDATANNLGTCSLSADDPANKKYIAPTCRLYPQADSLSCRYTDDTGVPRKGLEGYCLQTDPTNGNVCLLWYPISKIVSEGTEEGAAWSIANDLYYCIDAEDKCLPPAASSLSDLLTSGKAVNSTPGFACKEFIKVDKTQSWHNRLSPTNADYFPFGKSLTVDFGVNGGGNKTVPINSGVASGYYGAYFPASFDPNTEALFGVDAVGNKIQPFVSYYGKVYNQRDLCQGKPGWNNDNPQHYETEYIAASNVGEESKTFNPAKYDECYVVRSTYGEEKNAGDNWYYYSHPQVSGDNNNATKAYQVSLSSDNICNGIVPIPAGECHVNFSVDADGNKLFAGTAVKHSCGSPINNSDFTCGFACYNHDKQYQLADNQSAAATAVNQLFVRSQGDYLWNGSTYQLRNNGYNLTVPARDCGAARTGNDFCYVLPEISNIALNGLQAGAITIQTNGFVTLTFNSKVDVEQLPLTGFVIDWGYKDSRGQEVKTVSYNNSMYDRPQSGAAVHTFRQNYNYSLLTQGGGTQVKNITVTIKDNWGFTATAQAKVGIVVTQ